MLKINSSISSDSSQLSQSRLYRPLLRKSRLKTRVILNSITSPRVLTFDVDDYIRLLNKRLNMMKYDFMLKYQVKLNILKMKNNVPYVAKLV